LAKSNIYNLQFLESAENIKQVLTDALEREPSAEISRGVAVCIQQGRMFFDSASNAATEIRPLLLYYGMMAFAKAIVSGRGLRNLSTLSQTHGLTDISSQTARLAELKVRIEGRGTFQDFNDVISEREGLDYYENAMSQRHPLPTAVSAQLINTEITLKEILSRIPGLENLYLATFREKAEQLSFSLFNHGSPTEPVQLRIDIPDIFDDYNSLRQIIEGVREKYPTLQRWSLLSADKAYDNSIIFFENITPMENELAAENFVEQEEGRAIRLKTENHDPYIDFRELLDPIYGGLTQRPSLSSPINGAYLSDISLQYTGMFLLSSLVRYRPQVWVHAVSRFASHERPADDQALALIEGFMGTVQSTYPNLVAQLLTET
jgi:hypothetical protein